MSLKQALYLASYYGGADRLASLAFSARGAIVMFHRVVERASHDAFHPNRELEVTPSVLRAIIRSLRGNGFEIVPIGEVPERLATRTRQPFACLTFDDGYRDNLRLALPVCAEMQAPFTVYLTSGLMDRSATIWWEDLAALVRRERRIEMRLAEGERSFPATSVKEKAKAYAELSHHFERAMPQERESCVTQMMERYRVDGMSTVDRLAMTWDEARELAKHPLVTIGAHTVTHPSLASIAAENASGEIAASRSRIEKELGREVKHFAYPYGGRENATDREFAMCEELGFETAVTTRFGLIQNGTDVPLHALPRVTSNSFDDERTMRVKLSGLPALFSSH